MTSRKPDVHLRRFSSGRACPSHFRHQRKRERERERVAEKSRVSKGNRRWQIQRTFSLLCAIMGLEWSRRDLLEMMPQGLFFLALWAVHVTLV
ncbi:hypothetical protein MRB53_014576 [Persea americana]|uniref:Uncharacterized protein n=1 Tax=Persea americana TaxID=3435 RepID=A0ACC2KB99_PERAE|nr:hypothetical protein MRB53_014576 [Persea americana]